MGGYRFFNVDPAASAELEKASASCQGCFEFKDKYERYICKINALSFLSEALIHNEGTATEAEFAEAFKSMIEDLLSRCKKCERKSAAIYEVLKKTPVRRRLKSKTAEKQEETITEGKNVIRMQRSK